MAHSDTDSFGPVLHGTARAWRLKLDERLKPMGLSQAKWRTLLHLSRASQPMTQSEIASHLGIEEPTLVTLLHRLENDRWVSRRNSEHDRRCKTVHLAPRAQRVIDEINATATTLRHELLDEIAPADLRTCVRVLRSIQRRAERHETRTNGRNDRPHTRSIGNDRS